MIPNIKDKAMLFGLMCSFLFSFCTRQQQQTCTSPVYNDSTGVTIRGPCLSSQVLAPIGSTITFECSYNYFSGNNVQIPFWNITQPSVISLPIQLISFGK